MSTPSTIVNPAGWPYSTFARGALVTQRAYTTDASARVWQNRQMATPQLAKRLVAYPQLMTSDGE